MRASAQKRKENISAPEFIWLRAAHSLFLLDCGGEEEVVLLVPPSSSSLGSVFMTIFLSSTSMGSGFTSGSSFFTGAASSSVWAAK